MCAYTASYGHDDFDIDVVGSVLTATQEMYWMYSFRDFIVILVHYIQEQYFTFPPSSVEADLVSHGCFWTILTDI